MRKEVIGNCELYLGDCMEVMPMLGKVDAVVTDPPYGTTACKWDTVIPFEDMWLRLNKLIKPNGAIVLFGSEPFSSLLRVSNLKNYKYDWVWDKKKSGNIFLAKYQPMKTHENILVFSVGVHNYYPVMTPREEIKRSRNYGTGEAIGGYRIPEKKDREYTHRYPKSIQVFSNAAQKGKVHPTQKPIELMEYLIKTYTNQEETVLDFTMGSGTTGVACINTNRKFIGIEKEPEYFDIACKRIDEASRQKDLFI